jgi:hypothetical protein
MEARIETVDAVVKDVIDQGKRRQLLSERARMESERARMEKRARLDLERPLLSSNLHVLLKSYGDVRSHQSTASTTAIAVLDASTTAVPFGRSKEL